MIPILNDKPKYEMNIPSTGETVRFRPYLVKEEKILMMALESKDEKASLRAVIDTIKSCVHDEVNYDKLHLFDVEYMFTKIRGKSTGEIIELTSSCKSCDQSNDISVNIDEVKVIGDIKTDSKIILDEEYSVDMQWPLYNKMSNNENINKDSTDVEQLIELIGECIVSINTPEEVILVKDEPKEQLIRFIESMSSDQFIKMKEFLDKMPVCEVKHNFKCSSCGEENEINIRNISDFF
jgi:hypothetical protein